MFSRDGLNVSQAKLIKEILPNNDTTSYTYDLLGRVSSVTDAEGLVTEFTYDGLGNILKKAYSKGVTEGRGC